MTKKNQSASSKRWLKEHFDDHYVQKAQKEGWRSRAIYKLEEIQNKDKLIKRNDLERFCVGSHYQKRINLFRLEKLSQIATSMSRQEVLKLFINQYFNIFDLKTPCVQVPISFKGITIVNKKFVNLVHEQNKKIHVWTVDTQDQMQLLIDLGVDGIMTDRPSLLKDTLIKNNLWI